MISSLCAYLSPDFPFSSGYQSCWKRGPPYSRMGFLGSTCGKEPASQCRRHKRHRFDAWIRKIPWRKAWQPTPVFLPGESVDREAWQATVHGVAKSQRWLKWLSVHAQNSDFGEYTHGFWYHFSGGDKKPGLRFPWGDMLFPLSGPGKS